MGERACYDESKRCSETIFYEYYKNFNIEVKIARVFNTYGPYISSDDGRVMSNYIVRALNNQDIQIYGNGFQTRSFCYVSDMIEGFISLMKCKENKINLVNLGNEEEITITDLSYMIEKMTNSSSKIVNLAKLADDPTRRCPNINKAIMKLGWKPKISLEHGLENTINYYKNTSL